MNWLRELFFENTVLSWEHQWIPSLNFPCFLLKGIKCTNYLINFFGITLTALTRYIFLLKKKISVLFILYFTPFKKVTMV